MAPLVVQHRPFICSSRRVVTQPIDYNEQGIIENLTQNNQRSMWASRRIGEDEKVYLIHVQGTAGIGLPTTLVVKKFQNVNRCRSEMLLLATVRHENIINVLHVIERDEVSMLVYKYEVNGSLAYWLHRREGAGRPLSWPERRGIAIGVAKGLRHLHQGCNSQFVHHNINPSNILLDLDFNAKIASFGAAQVNMAGHGQPLRIPQFPIGNFGYAAPEYGIAPSQLTEKVDVYSFGVVLLELVTGRAANGAGPGGQLAMWARNNCNDLMANHLKRFKTEVDMEIPDQARYMKEMAAVFSLGVDCTVWDPQQRPSMRRALKRLRRSRRYSLWA